MANAYDEAPLRLIAIGEGPAGGTATNALAELARLREALAAAVSQLEDAIDVAAAAESRLEMERDRLAGAVAGLLQDLAASRREVRSLATGQNCGYIDFDYEHDTAATAEAHNARVHRETLEGAARDLVRHGWASAANRLRSLAADAGQEGGDDG